jgi:hypothetical protein
MDFQGGQRGAFGVALGTLCGMRFGHASQSLFVGPCKYSDPKHHELSSTCSWLHLFVVIEIFALQRASRNII